MSKMKLGPLQLKLQVELRSKKWKQGRFFLGDEKRGFCCLGIVASKVLNIEPVVKDGLTTYDGSSSLLGRYKDIGLLSNFGEFFEPVFVDGRFVHSLSSMNDGGWSFEEIADYIDANPDNVYTKSV